MPGNMKLSRFTDLASQLILNKGCVHKHSVYGNSLYNITLKKMFFNQSNL